jgi:hypothetical protein
MEVLRSSGYLGNSTNHAKSPLDAPVILKLENLASTQLLLRLTPITNAKSYNVQTSVNGNGGWTDAGSYTQARRIVLGGLTPGTSTTCGPAPSAAARDRATGARRFH